VNINTHYFRKHLRKWATGGISEQALPSVHCVSNMYLRKLVDYAVFSYRGQYTHVDVPAGEPQSYESQLGVL